MVVKESGRHVYVTIIEWSFGASLEVLASLLRGLGQRRVGQRICDLAVHSTRLIGKDGEENSKGYLYFSSGIQASSL